MTQRLAWILLAGALVLAIAALLVASRRDRPGEGASAGAKGAAGATAAEGSAAETGEIPALVRVELYFPGPGGRLMREAREIEGAADASGLAVHVVEALLAGPRSEPPYRPFPADVTLGEVHVAADGTAFVDLRSTASATPPFAGSTLELLALYSLVNSVVENVPGARALVVLWNGRQPRTFGGHVDTTRPLVPAPELARLVNDRPIGVFDSGVGGLTVARALLQAMPSESLLYLGDTARLPYGTKSADTVARYTRRNVAFLVAHGVKAVIIACNTASATALPSFDLEVPTWGVIEPGARAAATASRGRVGVIGTEATVRSGVYPRVIQKLRPELVVLAAACPLFVPLVEEGWENDPVTVEIARRYLEPLLRERIDTLVLGCTHYPMLAAVLRQVVGDDVALVDSAAAIAAEVASALLAAGLRAGEDAEPRHRLLVTDASPQFGRFASRILGPDVSLERVDVVD